jgi:hypothetical protein
MTADDFVEIVRKGADKVRVDKIVLNSGEQEFHGSGTLHIRDGHFRLKMQLDKGERLPPIQEGIHTKRDSWKMTGIIEYTLNFKCDSFQQSFQLHL